jgi:F-type H+-transporting ATPase subunit delta
MRNVRVARRYARAIMSVIEENGKELDRSVADLELVGATLRGSRELRVLLRSPVISAPRKRAVLRALFSARVGPLVASLLELLVAKQREHLLLDIIEQCQMLRDESLGVVNVLVTSASDLSGAQQKQLQKELERYTQKTVRLQLARDAALKGGIVVRIGDTVLDASLTRQLQILRARFALGGSHAN